MKPRWEAGAGGPAGARLASVASGHDAPAEAIADAERRLREAPRLTDVLRAQIAGVQAQSEISLLEVIERLVRAQGELQRLHDGVRAFAAQAGAGALLADVNRTGERVRLLLLDSMGRLQYQDVLRQRLDNVATGLAALDGWLDDTADALGGGGPAPARDMAAVLEGLSASYVMDEERAAHAEALARGSAGGHAVPLASEAGSLPKVQLF